MLSDSHRENLRGKQDDVPPSNHHGPLVGIIGAKAVSFSVEGVSVVLAPRPG